MFATFHSLARPAFINAQHIRATKNVLHCFLHCSILACPKKERGTNHSPSLHTIQTSAHPLTPTQTTSRSPHPRLHHRLRPSVLASEVRQTLPKNKNNNNSNPQKKREKKKKTQPQLPSVTRGQRSQNSHVAKTTAARPRLPAESSR